MADIRQAIIDAANAQGIPPAALLAIAQLESGDDPNAHNGSGASGLFQFMPTTSRQYNLTDPYDPVASANAGAHLYADNAAALRRSLGREPTAGEVYLAHQQGAGGAHALLTHPNATAASIIGLQAVRQNLPASMQSRAATMSAADFANFWVQRANSAAGPIPPADIPSNADPLNGGALQNPALMLPLPAPAPLTPPSTNTTFGGRLPAQAMNGIDRLNANGTPTLPPTDFTKQALGEPADPMTGQFVDRAYDPVGNGPGTFGDLMKLFTPPRSSPAPTATSQPILVKNSTGAKADDTDGFAPQSTPTAKSVRTVVLGPADAKNVYGTKANDTDGFAPPSTPTAKSVRTVVLGPAPAQPAKNATGAKANDADGFALPQTAGPISSPGVRPVRTTYVRPDGSTSTPPIAGDVAMPPGARPSSVQNPNSSGNDYVTFPSPKSTVNATGAKANDTDGFAPVAAPTTKTIQIVNPDYVKWQSAQGGLATGTSENTVSAKFNDSDGFAPAIKPAATPSPPPPKYITKTITVAAPTPAAKPVAKAASGGGSGSSSSAGTVRLSNGTLAQGGKSGQTYALSTPTGNAWSDSMNPNIYGT